MRGGKEKRLFTFYSIRKGQFCFQVFHKKCPALKHAA
jgi:hypothetical protein